MVENPPTSDSFLLRSSSSCVVHPADASCFCYSSCCCFPPPLPFLLLLLLPPLSFDEKTKLQKRAIELNQGRAAMMGLLGLMVHEKLGNVDILLPPGGN